MFDLFDLENAAAELTFAVDKLSAVASMFACYTDTNDPVKMLTVEGVNRYQSLYAVLQDYLHEVSEKTNELACDISGARKAS